MTENPHILTCILLVEKWLGLLCDIGHASATIKAYRRAMHHYLRHCAEQEVEPTTANFEDISGYIRLQLPGMENAVANSTLQLRISAIRLWYDYLGYYNLSQNNPVLRAVSASPIYSGRGLIPRQVRMPRIPDDSMWLTLLTFVAKAPVRDRLMLAFAYYGALRRNEVSQLCIEDLDVGHRLIHIRAENTKNRRERVVCYNPEITPVLIAHLTTLRMQGYSGGAIFRSFSDRNYGQPLTYWSWSKIVRKWAKTVNIPLLSTHTFRHLRLTHLARAGWKLHELSAYAGHRDPRTTQVYLHLSGADLALKMTGAIADLDNKLAKLVFSSGDIE
ncbi:tyrosine-type recombinase/integrase [Rahnella sp. PCH160]|uniref:tyrosine-type recombinase/integrase n=1 Tax=Rahnella sp. PCH160 TaxID=3447928 RepID=UPI0039FD3884